MIPRRKALILCSDAENASITFRIHFYFFFKEYFPSRINKRFESTGTSKLEAKILGIFPLK